MNDPTRIVLVVVWIAVAALALGPAIIAAIRVLYWTKYTGMRALLGFFVGTVVYCFIALYIAVSALLNIPPLQYAAHLLTLGHFMMLLPAAIFAYQVLWVFANRPPMNKDG